MRIFRPVVPVLFALLAIGAPAATAVLEAQATPVSPAEAEAFLGQWSLALDAQGQTFVMDLDIEDEDGTVTAEVSGEMAPVTKAESVSKAGEKLVLAFAVAAEGQQFPIVVTLTPVSDTLEAAVDVAGGMFVTTGKGTRRQGL